MIWLISKKNLKIINIKRSVTFVLFNSNANVKCTGDNGAWE